MCFPNSGRQGGKSKVSDLNGWPSFKTILKTKVKTGKTFFHSPYCLALFFLEIPGAFCSEERSSRLRQFFTNSQFAK